MLYKLRYKVIAVKSWRLLCLQPPFTINTERHTGQIQDSTGHRHYLQKMETSVNNR